MPLGQRIRECGRKRLRNVTSRCLGVSLVCKFPFVEFCKREPVFSMCPVISGQAEPGIRYWICDCLRMLPLR